jgi:hypothetical protein
MEVSNFYKKWVAFLKQRKVYGKYILCIQSANKNIITKQHGMWGTPYVSTIEPFFSKYDYFNERLKIQNIRDLSGHISLLSFRFCHCGGLGRGRGLVHIEVGHTDHHRHCFCCRRLGVLVFPP